MRANALANGVSKTSQKNYRKCIELWSKCRRERDGAASNADEDVVADVAPDMVANVKAKMTANMLADLAPNVPAPSAW